MIALRRFGLIITAGLLVLAASSESVAQEVRRFQPSRPTISPYLNLTRFNNSALPNYYSLVRPQLQQQAINQQQQQIRIQQQNAITNLRTSLISTQQEISGTGIGSWFQVNGTRAQFQNTSRFYPQVTVGQRQR